MRRVDQIALEIATGTLSLGRRIDDAAWAVARIKRLEAALKASKTVPGDRSGADIHNAVIDAVLNEDF